MFFNKLKKQISQLEARIEKLEGKPKTKPTKVSKVESCPVLKALRDNTKIEYDADILARVLRLRNHKVTKQQVAARLRHLTSLGKIERVSHGIYRGKYGK
jgi:predicted  nucleic acid-binding Zn-ribbon protein